MMLKRASLFAVLLCAGIAAAGCASSPKSPAEPADESAQFAPVNYLDICLLENNEVKSPKLVDAIESGFRKAGANVKRLRAGSGPDACSRRRRGKKGGAALCRPRPHLSYNTARALEVSKASGMSRSGFD